MKRSEIIPLPQNFGKYIALVEDIPLNDALKKFDGNWLALEEEKFSALHNKIYAPEKWTTKDIVQHVIDTERIFAYRALRFARNDATPLPGYDENFFAHNANAVNRTIHDLVQEFHVVRQSTIMLFQSFSAEMIVREGICFNIQLSAAAIGFAIVGHGIHHVNIIKERYYPLL